MVTRQMSCMPSVQMAISGPCPRAGASMIAAGVCWPSRLSVRTIGMLVSRFSLAILENWIFGILGDFEPLSLWLSETLEK
ncbi:MAG: hypothetical protein A2561_02920 [Candidatus Staskawiczbacteria bacterium RIFOXYD1_FULL_32_13]|uniref:Uncharacterized protein n=1 Tax=Candidatus Staskawiczbacteria bacterium RIFOXYD1_FULL_32_13 TaxID=1802234 RepID=A0A1G2JLJ0_9BACT|nr:MAG: hypothetical protein A2561_02920 [Candidatus Staskawiczbacteria bacterium RIFOXYD1_FULL_32_13]